MCVFFVSSRRRHTRCALVTGVQTCALPILPGGVGNPDRLRMEKRAIELVRGFHAAGKPVAAICHGPWLLVEADIIKGKTVTSWPSLRPDLKNAGGHVVDRAVVVDGNVLTSRQPADVAAFTNPLIQMPEKATPVAACTRRPAPPHPT